MNYFNLKDDFIIFFVHVWEFIKKKNNLLIWLSFYKLITNCKGVIIRLKFERNEGKIIKVAKWGNGK